MHYVDPAKIASECLLNSSGRYILCKLYPVWRRHKPLCRSLTQTLLPLLAVSCSQRPGIVWSQYIILSLSRSSPPLLLLAPPPPSPASPPHPSTPRPHTPFPPSHSPGFLRAPPSNKTKAVKVTSLLCTTVDYATMGLSVGCTC